MKPPPSRYGFPDLPADSYRSFPASVPWDTPISDLSGWWLEIQCPTCHTTGMPLRLMASRIGWTRTLRQIVPRLRCNACGAMPLRVDFVDDVGGDTGRFGATTKRLPLL